MELKLAIGNPGTKKTYKVELADGSKLIGKKIGDEVKGELVGLDGYTLKITGGTDSSGFPMSKSIEGSGRKRVLLKVGSLGFRSRRIRKLVKKEGQKLKRVTRKGERRRKSIRGNTISTDSKQINFVVVKAGKATPEKLLGLELKAEEVKVEEATKEKTEEKKE
tara:strand:- start:16 stop:507 length:492 start_codon:yes stop_codon:yes gene_type:complete